MSASLHRIMFFRFGTFAFFYFFNKHPGSDPLFFTGLELAVSARDVGSDKEDFYILLITAGFSLWNIGIGFLAGLVMQEMLKRKIFQV